MSVEAPLAAARASSLLGLDSTNAHLRPRRLTLVSSRQRTFSYFLEAQGGAFRTLVLREGVRLVTSASTLGGSRTRICASLGSGL